MRAIGANMKTKQCHTKFTSHSKSVYFKTWGGGAVSSSAPGQAQAHWQSKAGLGWAKSGGCWASATTSAFLRRACWDSYPRAGAPRNLTGAHAWRLTWWRPPDVLASLSAGHASPRLCFMSPMRKNMIWEYNIWALRFLTFSSLLHRCSLVSVKTHQKVHTLSECGPVSY